MYQSLPGLCRSRRPRLWLGLSRTDGGGAGPEPDRHRRSGATAQRLDFVRALRERMPGQDPAAEDAAPLARARICEKARSTSLADRSLAVVLGGAPTGALSLADRDGEPCTRLGRRPPWPIPQPPTCRWVDLCARLAGARGA